MAAWDEQAKALAARLRQEMPGYLMKRKAAIQQVADHVLKRAQESSFAEWRLAAEGVFEGDRTLKNMVTFSDGSKIKVYSLAWKCDVTQQLYACRRQLYTDMTILEPKDKPETSAEAEMLRALRRELMTRVTCKSFPYGEIGAHLEEGFEIQCQKKEASLRVLLLYTFHVPMTEK